MIAPLFVPAESPSTVAKTETSKKQGEADDFEEAPGAGRLRARRGHAYGLARGLGRGGDLPDAANHPLLQPIDPQNWVDQAELTWDAYTQIRPDSWNDASSSTGSQSQYKTAVILLQFQDQPFLITQAAGTHPFGNPQPGWQPVPPAAGRGLVLRLLRRAEPVQRRADDPRLLDGGQLRQDRS